MNLEILETLLCVDGKKMSFVDEVGLCVCEREGLDVT